MGTNYYWYEDKESVACPTCGYAEPGPPPLHVGKSSSGWVFSFHAIPERGINSFRDWLALFDSGSGYILDEYGEAIQVPAFLKLVQLKQVNDDNLRHALMYPSERDYLDAEGFSFSVGEFS
jgi:hypothetical protein